SVSKDGGRTSYRGLLRIGKGARNVKSTVQCDALLLDDTSRSDTYPTMRIEEDDATIAHEATVGKVGQEQLFYLMQRGLSEEQAMALIVLGFIAEFTKALPLEYSIELNKLIELEMEGSIG
ncbi:MAG: SufD family Fe-S cluster assembly protein, partial [Nanoarchaeota archaeon]